MKRKRPERPAVRSGRFVASMEESGPGQVPGSITTLPLPVDTLICAFEPPRR